MAFQVPLSYLEHDQSLTLDLIQSIWPLLTSEFGSLTLRALVQPCVSPMKREAGKPE